MFSLFKSLFVGEPDQTHTEAIAQKEQDSFDQIPDKIVVIEWDDIVSLALDESAQLDSTEIVIPEKEIKVHFSYPFNNPKVLTLVSKTERWTRRDIYNAIRNMYKIIYEQERQTSSLKEESISTRTNGDSLLINRAETNGVWGIWGHDLEDLAITGISRNEDEDVWHPIISS